MIWVFGAGRFVTGEREGMLEKEKLLVYTAEQRNPKIPSKLFIHRCWSNFHSRCCPSNTLKKKYRANKNVIAKKKKRERKVCFFLYRNSTIVHQNPLQLQIPVFQIKPIHWLYIDKQDSPLEKLGEKVFWVWRASFKQRNSRANPQKKKEKHPSFLVKIFYDNSCIPGIKHGVHFLRFNLLFFCFFLGIIKGSRWQR